MAGPAVPPTMALSLSAPLFSVLVKGRFSTDVAQIVHMYAIAILIKIQIIDLWLFFWMIVVFVNYYLSTLKHASHRI